MNNITKLETILKDINKQIELNKIGNDTDTLEIYIISSLANKELQKQEDNSFIFETDEHLFHLKKSELLVFTKSDDSKIKLDLSSEDTFDIIEKYNK